MLYALSWPVPSEKFAVVLTEVYVIPKKTGVTRIAKIMPTSIFRTLAALALTGVCLSSAPVALGDSAPLHAISMHGTPALPPDFVSLPQVNREAPKGGRMVMGEEGTFNTLNPFTLKGRAPWAVSSYTVETLMGRNYDEPFSLYGWLAESVQTDDARSYVQFTLRESARFSDGSAVTVADVIWSFETLGKSHPRYKTAYDKVARVEQVGERAVKFTFHQPDRELPLLLGLRPVLKAAQWEGRDFEASDFEPIIGSGPYVIDRFEAGRFITLRRNPDWWAKDLPLMAGQHNFDELRYDYFADSTAMFEAFKAGELSFFREASAQRWATGYDFPRQQSDEVLRAEIPHGRPSGMMGLAMNTRREKFSDWRVRQALIESFNFEFINETINASAVPRVGSYFFNSDLGMGQGPASSEVRALLEPFADSLPPDALDEFALPKGDGSEAHRAGIRRATALMAEAGWTIDNGALKNARGEAFAIDLLVLSAQADIRAAAAIWSRALERLGVALTITAVDPAQYNQRTDAYDFDMTPMTRVNSLSPGNEQRLYWGAIGVETPGTRNLPGFNSPAVEAMIDRLVNTTQSEDLALTAQALDRALMAGRYVIPLWFADRSRIAFDRRLHYPADRLPVYGDWAGFHPDIWWYQE